MFRRASLCFLLIAFATVAAPAQHRPGGSGGGRTTPGVGNTTSGSLGNSNTTPGNQRTVDLRIRVAYPNERSVGENVQVLLLSSTGGTVSQYFTNSEGEVTFSGLNPGSYTIKVTGSTVKEYTSETFVLERNQGSRTEWVHVQPAGEGNSVANSKDAMVSAADLNVPDKAKKEFNKANDALAAGDFKKATEKYRKAIELYPRYSMAYNNLGAAYMRANDANNARDAFAKAVEINPALSSANANLARLEMHDKKFGQAIPLLDRALASAPKDGELLLLMADAQLESGHFDEAASYARKVHGVEHQKFAVAHLIAARALESENKLDEARAEYQVFIQEAPDSAQVPMARQALARLTASAQRTNDQVPR